MRAALYELEHLTPEYLARMEQEARGAVLGGGGGRGARSSGLGPAFKPTAGVQMHVDDEPNFNQSPPRLGGG